MTKAMDDDRGFSLIELMVTLAVLALLLTLGVPSFSQLSSNNRAAAFTNDLQFSLKLARSEAIKRGARVALCPRASVASGAANAAQCSNAAADWQNGWLVMNESSCVDGAGCHVLHDIQIDTQQHTIRYGQSRVRFDPNGRMVTGIGGTFSICDSAVAGSLRRVIITGSGRTRLEKGGDCA